MPHFSRLALGLVLGFLASGWVGAQEKPATREPTAQQLEKAITEARRGPVALYRVEVDPFSNAPVHSFRVIQKPKEFPVIPFAHELALVADEAPVGLEVFAAAKTKPAVRLRNVATRGLDWKKLTGVESLTLDGTQADPRDLVPFDSLTTLVGRFVDADLKELKKLKNLKSLTVVNVEDAGLKELSEFPSLERLLIRGEFGKRTISKEGFKSIGAMKNLKQLSISNYSGDRESLLELRKLEGLTHLRLENVGPRGGLTILQGIEALKSLTTLELSEVSVLPGYVRPSLYKSLTTLRIEGSLLDRDILKDLKDAKNLKHLTISGDKASDADLELLQGLPLETLRLKSIRGSGPDRGGNITGIGVARAVKGMKTLTTLDLDSVPLFPPVPAKGGVFEAPPKKDDPLKKDPGPKAPDVDAAATQKQKAEIVAAFKGLTNLRSLNLHGTVLKEEDVEWLREMKSLHYLYLDGRVSNPVVSKLVKELPNCTVTKFLERRQLIGNEPTK